MNSTRPIRILLVDGHPKFLGAVRELLEADEDLRVVGEASGGREATEKVTKLEPDVTLVDVSTPMLRCLYAMWRLGHTSQVIALSLDPQEWLLFPVLATGARGYVSKTKVDLDLVRAIKTVTKGELFLDRDGTKLFQQQSELNRNDRYAGLFNKHDSFSSQELTNE